jgi:hypothetical protein
MMNLTPEEKNAIINTARELDEELSDDLTQIICH